MNRKIIAATNNKGKLAELKKILSSHSFAVLSLAEAGITAVPDETGTTFEENARIKAREIFALAKQTYAGGSPAVIADDSGLEVDFLGGEPGVYSANYDIPWLLEKLGNTPYEKRGARFVCCICYIDESGNEQFFHGTCEGTIGFESKGENGFGYDPVFEIREGTTMAMLTDDEKNALSHRGNALRKFAEFI
ncbi:MAG: RdgB/HAM1 family non-canonical purine NTP pyrophosphatase [Oscillospiraceae bacterium]|nr:RdgB/HAM1 family non-canonical purine NTP pyrophosphatase [Oscillospiraceae bacterium]